MICRLLLLTTCASLLGSAADATIDVASVRPDQIREIHVTRPKRDIRSLKVVSWNIDRGTDWKEIAAELKAEPADLLLLQEVDWNTVRTGRADVASELAHSLDMNGVFAIEFEELGQEDGQKAYTGQATLTRIPIVRSRILAFQHQSNFWKPRSWLPSNSPLMQRRSGERIALVTELSLGRRHLVVYNVHLESRSYGRIQMEQIDEILADAKRYSPDTSILLAGDLNTKYLPSIFLKKLEQAGFESSTGNKIVRTHKVVAALDWIFAKGPIVAEEGSVRRDMKGSDHYPIYADLRELPARSKSP